MLVGFYIRQGLRGVMMWAEYRILGSFFSSCKTLIADGMGAGKCEGNGAVRMEPVSATDALKVLLIVYVHVNEYIFIL
jgi:hypothetical protein